jgi:hypothetical protein
VLHRPPNAGVKLVAGGVPAGQLDQRLQGVGSLEMQRDAALGVALADRDPQPRVPVGVGVEAVDREAADLVAAGAAPAGDDQRRALVGIGQLLDGGHQRGQLVVGDEPGQRPGGLRDVRADEQHPAGHVVPLPGGGLVDKPGQQSDHRAAGGHGQRRAGVPAGLGAEPAQKLLGVLAVQLPEVGDLRVGRSEPLRVGYR